MNKGNLAKICVVISVLLFVAAVLSVVSWKCFLEWTQWREFGKGVLFLSIVITALGCVLLVCGLVLFIFTSKQAKQQIKQEPEKNTPCEKTPSTVKQNTRKKSYERKKFASSSPQPRKLVPCKKCGAIPTVKEGWDTLQIVCSCGNTGKIIFGDYYDEAFMLTIYGEEAFREWNKENS